MRRYPTEAPEDVPYTPVSADPFSSEPAHARMSRTEVIGGMMFEMHPSASANAASQHERGQSSRDAVEDVVTADERVPRKELLQTSGEVASGRGGGVDGEDAPPPAYAREV
jgi:hypothetical protein